MWSSTFILIQFKRNNDSTQKESVKMYNMISDAQFIGYWKNLVWTNTFSFVLKADSPRDNSSIFIRRQESITISSQNALF